MDPTRSPPIATGPEERIEGTQNGEFRERFMLLQNGLCVGLFAFPHKTRNCLAKLIDDDLDGVPNVRYTCVILSDDGRSVRIVNNSSDSDSYNSNISNATTHITKFVPTTIASYVSKLLAFRNAHCFDYPPYYCSRFYPKHAVVSTESLPRRQQWIIRRDVSQLKTSVDGSGSEGIAIITAVGSNWPSIVEGSTRVVLSHCSQQLVELSMPVPLDIDEGPHATYRPSNSSATGRTLEMTHRRPLPSSTQQPVALHKATYAITNVPTFLYPVVAAMQALLPSNDKGGDTRTPPVETANTVETDNPYFNNVLDKPLRPTHSADISGASTMLFREACEEIVPEVGLLIDGGRWPLSAHLAVVLEWIDGHLWCCRSQSSEGLEEKVSAQYNAIDKSNREIEVEMWINPAVHYRGIHPLHPVEGCSFNYSQAEKISLRSSYFTWSRGLGVESALHVLLLHSSPDTVSSSAYFDGQSLAVLQRYRSQFVRLLSYRDALETKRRLIPRRVADSPVAAATLANSSYEAIQQTLLPPLELSLGRGAVRLTALRGATETDIRRVRGLFPGRIIVDLDVTNELVYAILESGETCQYTLRYCIACCQQCTSGIIMDHDKYSTMSGRNKSAISIHQHSMPSQLIPCIQRLLTFYRWARLPDEGKRQFIADEQRRTTVAREYAIRTQRAELMAAVAKGRLSPHDAVERMAAIVASGASGSSLF